MDMLSPKLRLLCSYGGRIMPLPPSNTLHYIGGETRLAVVPRGISFGAFFEHLSGKLLSGRSFSLKYRIPGYDLDSLITVSDNDDLQNLIDEYDSSRFRRIRLFLFPLYHPDSTPHSVFGLEPDATADENRKQDEATTTSVSLLPPENTTASDAGGVPDNETEKVEIQDQPRSIVEEPSQQPHTVTHPVASPATEDSSSLDPVTPGHQIKST